MIRALTRIIRRVIFGIRVGDYGTLPATWQPNADTRRAHARHLKLIR